MSSLYASRAVLVVLLVVIFHDDCKAQAPCTKSGWFGPGCQFLCHCHGGHRYCNKVTGVCTYGCHTDWFGPACQYKSIGFTAWATWLTDKNDETCNTGSSWSGQFITVTLDTPVPITWIRIVAKDDVYLDQIKLSYQAVDSSTPLPCPDQGKAQLYGTSIDMMCSSTVAVSQLTLSGSGVGFLCSIYINGGRNVAQYEETHQSSWKTPTMSGAPSNSYLPDNAVDGQTGTSNLNLLSTCTHTATGESPHWWSVTFSHPMDIMWVLIYNTYDDCCKTFLQNFSLTIEPQSPGSATAYTYTDSKLSAEAVYTVVPPPSSVNFPASQVRIDVTDSGNDTSLNLCEVFVFGEKSCPGRYGLYCEHRCNCANQANCLVHNGACPSGCAPGYTGLDCKVCAVGRYGRDCSLICNEGCYGDSNACDPNEGSCNCDKGYSGKFCEINCNMTIRAPSATITSPGYPENYMPNTECLTKLRSDIISTYFIRFVYYYLNTYDSVKIYKVAPAEGPAQTHQSTPGASQPGALVRVEPPLVLGRGSRHNTEHSQEGFGLDIIFISDRSSVSKGFEAEVLITPIYDVCPDGNYGDYCRKNCSETCGGVNSPCNRTTGACNQGCEPGYNGIFCELQCPLITFGDRCTQNCSEGCGGPYSLCDIATGACLEGCDPGYSGDRCDQGFPHDSGALLRNIVIAFAAVAVVAAVVIGILAWRLCKVSRNLTELSSKEPKSDMETGPQLDHPGGERQEPGNRTRAVGANNRHHYYNHADHVYQEDSETYANPEDFVRSDDSEDYEIPQPIPVSQD